MTAANPSGSSSFPALLPSGVWVVAPPEQAVGRALEHFKDMGGSGVILDVDLWSSEGSIQESARLARSLGMQAAVSLDLDSLRRHSLDAFENPLFGEIEEYCQHLLITVNDAQADEAVLKQSSVSMDAAPSDIPRLLDELLPELRRYLRLWPDPEQLPEWLPEIAAELGPHGFMVDRPPLPDVSWRGPDETVQLVESLREQLGGHSPVFYTIPFMTPEEGAQAPSLALPIAAALAEQDVQALVVGMFEFQEVSWVPGLVSLLQGFPANLPEIASGFTAPDVDAEKTGDHVAEEREPAPPERGVNATILSDRPIGPETLARPDHLGHSVYAAALYQLVTHEDTSLPLSIAVSAPWGSGKSSIMRWLQYELDWHREGTRHRCTVIPGWDADSNAQPGSTAAHGVRALVTRVRHGAGRALGLIFKWHRRDGRSPVGVQPNGGEKAGDGDDELPLKRRCKTVWIDAWKYEDSTALWAALTKEIYDQARRQMGGPGAQYK
ncbi:MAG: P-loop NTPase fold protein, partial [Chloroflexota bacterium]